MIKAIVTVETREGTVFHLCAEHATSALQRCPGSFILGPADSEDCESVTHLIDLVMAS
jgi:hypothetical protein